jgi:hypothetical protein
MSLGPGECDGVLWQRRRTGRSMDAYVHWTPRTDVHHGGGRGFCDLVATMTIGRELQDALLVVDTIISTQSMLFPRE